MTQVKRCDTCVIRHLKSGQIIIYSRQHTDFFLMRFHLINITVQVFLVLVSVTVR